MALLAAVYLADPRDNQRAALRVDCWDVLMAGYSVCRTAVHLAALWVGVTVSLSALRLADY